MQKNRKWYRIEQIIPENLSIIYTPEGGSQAIELMSNYDIIHYVENVYCGFLFQSSYDESVTIQTNKVFAGHAVTNLWNIYMKEKQRDLDRFFNTLYKDYDPLVNFYLVQNGKIIDELHKNHNETETYNNITDSMNGGATDTSTPTIKTRSTNYVAGADSTTGVLEGYNESETLSGDVKNINSHNSTNTRNGSKILNITDNGENEFDKNVRLFIDYEKKGNSGVFSSQRLVKEELEIRLNNYLLEIIEFFFNKFCIYFEPYCEEDVIE